MKIPPPSKNKTKKKKIVLTVSTSCQELSTPGSGSLKVNFYAVQQIYPYPVNTAGFVNPYPQPGP